MENSEMDILKIKENSAIQAHINMMQGIINRMAANSANCKTWLITILAAIFVLVVDDKICSDKIWIAYIPTGLFFFLDCFYLGLERSFIKKQNVFIKKINQGDDIAIDVFALKTEEYATFYKKVVANAKNFINQFLYTIRSVGSFSIFPFYGIICLLIYLLTI